jgi:CubicO group peptidase (beta-lactamase class C family)
MDALDAVVGWPTDSAAVGVMSVVDGPRLLGTVGPDDRAFAWASCTKPATALAVLVAVEEGSLDLDEAAGPPGATVRHLLAHASGLGPEPGPAIAPPGERRIYSNAGFEVLADLLSARAGMDFATYLAEGVLRPLGMTATELAPDASPGPAAAGLVGPLRDLLALAAEWAVPTLVSEATHRLATSVAFPGLAGVLPGFRRFDPCDWGLGVEVRGEKHPHWTGATNSPGTFGHFGRSGSFLWIDPVAGLLCAGLADRPFGMWSARAWPELADAVLAEVGERGPGGPGASS